MHGVSPIGEALHGVPQRPITSIYLNSHSQMDDHQHPEKTSTIIFKIIQTGYIYNMIPIINPFYAHSLFLELNQVKSHRASYSIATMAPWQDMRQTLLAWLAQCPDAARPAARGVAFPSWNWWFAQFRWASQSNFMVKSLFSSHVHGEIPIFTTFWWFNAYLHHILMVPCLFSPHFDGSMPILITCSR